MIKTYLIPLYRKHDAPLQLFFVRVPSKLYTSPMQHITILRSTKSTTPSNSRTHYFSASSAPVESACIPAALWGITSDATHYLLGTLQGYRYAGIRFYIRAGKIVDTSPILFRTEVGSWNGGGGLGLGVSEVDGGRICREWEGFQRMM